MCIGTAVELEGGPRPTTQPAQPTQTQPTKANKAAKGRAKGAKGGKAQADRGRQWPTVLEGFKGFGFKGKSGSADPPDQLIRSSCQSASVAHGGIVEIGHIELDARAMLNGGDGTEQLAGAHRPARPAPHPSPSRPPSRPRPPCPAPSPSRPPSRPRPSH